MEDADLGRYIRFQEGTGSIVETYNFHTSVEEEAQIAARIAPADTSPGIGQGGMFTCAIHVSESLQGIGPFKGLGTYFLPGNLADELSSGPSGYFGWWRVPVLGGARVGW